MKPETFYRKKAHFGLDIGSDSIKAVQLKQTGSKWHVDCYGMMPNAKNAIKDGVIVDTQGVAKAVDNLLSSHLVGALSAERAILSVPIARVFTRVLDLPSMKPKQLKQAIDLEIEQSIPRAAAELYVDYEIIQKDSENTEVQLVAVPKKIIDSYMAVCKLLRLETVLIETNIQAAARLINKVEKISKEQPFFIIDVGGKAIDLGAFDSTLRVTGTIDEGGETLTDAIAGVLNIDRSQAHLLKTIYGINLSSKQAKIAKAVEPILHKVALEAKRMERFYQERVNKRSIGQIILTGGGANMPGIGDFLTNELRIPTRVCAPWSQAVSFGKLPKPPQYELPRYLTATGLAITTEEDLK